MSHDEVQRTRPTAGQDIVWVEDINDNTVASYAPTLVTDGVSIPAGAGMSCYCKLRASGSAGINGAMKLYVWDAADTEWLLIEDLGTVTEDPSGELAVIWRRTGLSDFTRVGFGVVGTPAGSPTSFITKFGFVLE